ncbi:MAG: hypothetical protein RL722_1748, partial [Pseudomonadota bacterium]
LTVAFCAVALLAGTPLAEAKRLGGGGGAGMQRQMPAKPANANPAPTQAPAQNQAAPATPATPAAPPAAVPQKRSWMGPLAGLAAGLGLAALASHFGFGEGLANIMTILLVGVLAFLVIGWLMRRFGPKPAQPAMAYAGRGLGQGEGQSAPAWQPAQPAPAGASTSAYTPSSGISGSADAASHTAPAAEPVAFPPGFDRAGFERLAKTLFIRLQASNDAGQLDDIRRFTTPELFAAIRLDLQDRAGKPQQTDVERVDAEVVDMAQADGQWVVSVRFHGLIREEAGATAAPFDELWHLVRPLDESREWAIAGIQQNEAPKAASTVH